MPKESTAAAKNRRKFHKQTASIRERLGATTSFDLPFLDGLPKFTGKDEMLPFPYGRERGRKVGRSKHMKTGHAHKPRLGQANV